MKKGIRVILSLLMVVSMMAINMNVIYATNNQNTRAARRVSHSGKCGSNATWKLYSDGQL